jgi:hypothetical protein
LGDQGNSGLIDTTARLHCGQVSRPDWLLLADELRWWTRYRHFVHVDVLVINMAGNLQGRVVLLRYHGVNR